MLSLSISTKMWQGASEMGVTSCRKFRKAAQESTWPVVFVDAMCALRLTEPTPWLVTDRITASPGCSDRM